MGVPVIVAQADGARPMAAADTADAEELTGRRVAAARGSDAARGGPGGHIDWQVEQTWLIAQAQGG